MKKTIEKENYLKAFYKLEEKNNEISVTALSKYFKVSKSTVSNMIKKLVKMGFVETEPYKEQPQRKYEEKQLKSFQNIV